MKINIIILTILLLFSNIFTTNAQSVEPPTKSYIQLIDGSVIKGVILEHTDHFLKVKIINGDVLLLDQELIATVDDGVQFPTKPMRSALRKNGYYNILSTGLLAGRDAQLEEGLLLNGSFVHYVRGFHFNQYLGVGLGFGLDSYSTRYMPVYLDIRGNQNLGKTTFFYALQGGYGITRNDFGGQFDEWSRERGGLMLHPTVGIKVPTKSKLNVLFEFGLKNQWSRREYRNREFEDEMIFRRYSFRIGFEF